MKVRGLSTSGTRLEAEVEWEDANRATTTLYFDVLSEEGPSPLDATLFAISLIPLATFHGERRLAIEEPVSALVLDRFLDVHRWWVHWGLVQRPPLVVESPRHSNRRSGWASAAFLSGGVDSLHMLKRNHETFPAGHEHRISRALMFGGFDSFYDEDRQRQHFMIAAEHVQDICKEAGIGLVRVFTNARYIDPDPYRWMRIYHGAVLSAGAHSAVHGNGAVRIASSYDIPNLVPWGSHPALDMNFSSERLTLWHEGASFSRLQKVSNLASWATATANMRVCTTQNATLNCGVCEKCVRTKLEFLAVGMPVPPSFTNADVTRHLLEPIAISNEYQALCYRDVVEPLAGGGHSHLAAEVRRKLRQFTIRRRTIAARSWARSALDKANERSGGRLNWLAILLPRKGAKYTNH